jgi:signal transduction histidine kinase
MPDLREAIASPQARLELLLQASELLGRSLDYEATLASLHTLLVPRIADGYVVDVLDAQGALHRIAAVDENPAKAELVERLKHIGQVNPDAPHGVQRLLAAGEALLIERMDEEELRKGARNEEHFEIMKALDLTSGLVVPLRASGRSIGMLWLYSARSKRVYTREDLGLVEEVAARAALAIENARLWRESQDAIHARDEFLAIASHELRTPLTSLLLRVQGELRRLRREPDYTPNHADLTEWLTLTNTQISRLARLVEELLDVSHITSGKLRLAHDTADLLAVATEAAGLLADEARRKGSTLAVQGEPGIIGWWDPLRLEQVVVALLSNAIKYGEGRPIDVRVERGEDTASVMVRDRGIGIDPAHTRRIFERFGRQVSSRHYGGFGLGLWVARQIVEASGGNITVESAPGAGSTFHVHLPLAPPSAP